MIRPKYPVIEKTTWDMLHRLDGRDFSHIILEDENGEQELASDANKDKLQKELIDIVNGNLRDHFDELWIIYKNIPTSKRHFSVDIGERDWYYDPEINHIFADCDFRWIYLTLLHEWWHYQHADIQRERDPSFSLNRRAWFDFWWPNSENGSYQVLWWFINEWITQKIALEIVENTKLEVWAILNWKSLDLDSKDIHSILETDDTYHAEVNIINHLVEWIAKIKNISIEQSRRELQKANIYWDFAYLNIIDQLYWTGTLEEIANYNIGNLWRWKEFKQNRRIKKMINHLLKVNEKIMKL